MKCPYCGKTESDVVDSRPTKDEIVIKRRRECLSCQSRFTTFETTEEQVLPYLIRKDDWRGPTVTNFKIKLSFMARAFKELTKGVKTLMDDMNKYEKIHAPKALKAKATRPKPKKVPAKKIPVKKQAVKVKPARKSVPKKPKEVTAIGTVLSVIRRSRKGVDTARLKEKTGFEERKIWNIIKMLKKQDKVKSGGIGIYMKT